MACVRRADANYGVIKMKPILKYPGAKWRIAEFIVQYIPPHNFYLEPWFGSGAVFFNKYPSKHETINDIDGLVVNFFEVCRDHPEELIEKIQLTPFARDEFLSVEEDHAGGAIHLTGDKVEDARRFAVRCWMGFGSKLSDRVGFKVNRQSNGPQNPKIWDSLPETIVQASKRIKNATIENGDAVDLIHKHNQEDCFIYADPPYLLETRRSRIYRCESGDRNRHIELLEALKAHKGTVILSGYENELYDEYLQGWSKAKINTTATCSKQRTETIWMNFEPNLFHF